MSQVSIRVGEYVPNNITNKILFIPNFEKDLHLFHKVCSEFLEYSFINPDSELIVVVDGLYEVGHYIYHYIFRIAMANTYRVRYVIRRKTDIFDLLKDVKYYVPSNYGKEELDVMDEAVEHGVKILPPFGENIFVSLPVNKKCVEEKAKLAKALYSELIQKYSPEEYDYFLYHQGLGESIITFYLLKEYKERFGRKIIFLCTDPSRTHIFEQCPYVDVSATVNTTVFAYIAIFWEKKYNMKNGLEMWFAPYAPDYGWPKASSKNGIITTVRRFMGLPVWSGVEKYPVDILPKSKDIVRKKIAELNIRQGKTFFVVTNGVTFGKCGLTPEFWKKVIRELEGLGYDVVVSSETPWDDNIKTAYFKPFEAVEFVNYCGNILSVTTGIFEFVCCMTKPQVNAYTFYLHDVNVVRNNYPGWLISSLPHLCYEHDNGNFFETSIAEYRRVLFGDFFGNVKNYLCDVTYDKNLGPLWANIKKDIPNLHDKN